MPFLVAVTGCRQQYAAGLLELGKILNAFQGRWEPNSLCILPLSGGVLCLPGTPGDGCRPRDAWTRSYGVGVAVETGHATLGFSEARSSVWLTAAAGRRHHGRRPSMLGFQYPVEQFIVVHERHELALRDVTEIRPVVR